MKRNRKSTSSKVHMGDSPGQTTYYTINQINLKRLKSFKVSFLTIWELLREGYQ